MIASLNAAAPVLPGLAVADAIRSDPAGLPRPGQAASIGATPSAAEEAARVSLSAAGRAAASADSAAAARPGAVPAAGDGQAPAEDPAGPAALTPEELKQVEQLQARDREVRAHEQAHQAAAGGLGGGASYTYQRGPDGVSYAIGGEVRISLREGRTPADTIANAQTIRAAALAPADPSAQDRAVAAAAAQMIAEAQAELAQQVAAAGVPAEAGGSTGAAAPDAAGAAGAPRAAGATGAPDAAAGAAGAVGPGLAASSAASGAASPFGPAASADPAAAAAALAGDRAVERTRAGLAQIYGLIGASSSGFAARA